MCALYSVCRKPRVWQGGSQNSRDSLDTCSVRACTTCRDGEGQKRSLKIRLMCPSARFCLWLLLIVVVLPWSSAPLHSCVTAVSQIASL